MTVVVKLGSSIVADDGGGVRGDVLDRVCAQVAELHHGGEEVAMVTSGAIALGMRLMELDERPGTIDELQAASAVGQGTLFRAYESRLAAADVHAAQVLLTSFDLSVRMHYLNARQALRRLLAVAVRARWSTRTTPPPPTRSPSATTTSSPPSSRSCSRRGCWSCSPTPTGLHTADPRRDPTAALVERGRRFRRARRATRSATGPRPSARAACAARSPPRRWPARPGSRR